jgi:hypothetical protein
MDFFEQVDSLSCSYSDTLRALTFRATSDHYHYAQAISRVEMDVARYPGELVRYTVTEVANELSKANG